MSLKYRIEKLEDVPEAVRSLYTEKDGKFVLEVDGAVASERLNEFRDNNTNLLRERDILTKRFEGIDPDKAREAQTQADRLREGKLIEQGKVEELLEARVTAMKRDHDKQIKALTSERDTLSGKLGGLVIDTALRDAAMKAGVRAQAVDDVLLRGRGMFKLKDGEAVALDGDKPVFGKSGDPMKIDEWVGGLTTAAPHLFEPSSGGGARGSGNGAGGGKTIRRSEFDALPPMQKNEAAKTLTVVD